VATRGAEASQAREPGDLLFIVMGEQMYELARGALQPSIPAPPRSRGNGQHDPGRWVPRNDATHCVPVSPEMSRDKGGEHTPRRAALRCWAEVANDPDPREPRIPREDARKIVMNVERTCATPRACAGAVPFRVAKALLVGGEIVHIDGDESPATKARPTRLDQAGFGGGRTASANRRVESGHGLQPLELLACLVRQIARIPRHEVVESAPVSPCEIAEQLVCKFEIALGNSELHLLGSQDHE